MKLLIPLPGTNRYPVPGSWCASEGSSGETRQLRGVSERSAHLLQAGDGIVSGRRNDKETSERDDWQRRKTRENIKEKEEEEEEMCSPVEDGGGNNICIHTVGVTHGFTKITSA